jgi:hypothetical protein
MKLTRGKLLKQPDWSEWQDSEYLQLNQYYDQGMFGTPQWVDNDAAVFHTVWTYAVKALDRRKKARFACDGSPRSGQARILDETYANCVDQTLKRYLINYPYLSDYGQTIFCLSFPSRDRATAPGRCE